MPSCHPSDSGRFRTSRTPQHVTFDCRMTWGNVTTTWMLANSALGWVLIAPLWATLCQFCAAANAQPTSTAITDCSLVIAGGTTAALAAAISAAKFNTSVCLLEPTDWVGGQMTASGVSAIDFAWHTLTNPTTKFVYPVYKYARQRENLTPLFTELVSAVGDPGRCWVSTNCYSPGLLLDKVRPLLAGLPTLRVFYNTVPKRVTVRQSPGAGDQTVTLTSLTAIQRTPTQGDGYDRTLSEDLADWYSERPSARFDKRLLAFQPAAPGQDILFMDATEWGELLVLSGAPYLQGVAERYDGDISGLGGNETCGQSATYGFSERLNADPQPEPPNPRPRDFGSFFNFQGYTWDKIFTYRRLVGGGTNPTTGDLTLQNWSGGNDNAFAYLFLDKQTAAAQAASDWRGGVSVDALATGEALAYGWHYYYKAHADPGDRLTLDRATWGTATGLVKVPYIRDTRRSVGLGGFVMRVADISGWPDPAGNMTGLAYPDRVALGCYDVDTHPSPKGCPMPGHIGQYYPILPFFVPLRALTNARVGNLLVAGKTMAQSFLTNSATRLHPTEWSTGAAAGAVASFMLQAGVHTTGDLWADHLAQAQMWAAKATPARWTIEGRLYPQ
ncbi:putative FAD-dependent oxidoreductase [Paratrimastix pyriformis]|uniref:FAD-dependent oxidoreductase n=1 Tax=Paratrimastix pyriformis TaxID=342808 RepID=A0ABQ8UV78_9EUKA|nr:putative FAD-dependent oxidoreductase [Paratrimastix pyriformis]